ncbi:hypothetical protein RvY_08363 [Ramazzottius varieornatus]|uniref:Uncharacterized protein n=1 Tax=Ramazzottius varieornatus TaxID=947166 RepID=A0A1D1V7W8_RAMVA|nr:hypothetical protein RvY_08363 [Ramazzottius varieornatus]
MGLVELSQQVTKLRGRVRSGELGHLETIRLSHTQLVQLLVSTLKAGCNRMTSRLFSPVVDIAAYVWQMLIYGTCIKGSESSSQTAKSPVACQQMARRSPQKLPLVLEPNRSCPKEALGNSSTTVPAQCVESTHAATQLQMDQYFIA